jgi:hypothetical protein
VTVPLPFPALLTVSVRAMVNVAFTVFAESIVTTHVPVPEQPPPDQAVKTDPESAVAVSVTVCCAGKLSVQSLGQLIPEGELATFPVPDPSRVTVRTKFVGLNVASTVRLTVIATVHCTPEEESHPLHPPNVEPTFAAAVNVTEVPSP